MYQWKHNILTFPQNKCTEQTCTDSITLGGDFNSLNNAPFCQATKMNNDKQVVLRKIVCRLCYWLIACEQSIFAAAAADMSVDQHSMACHGYFASRAEHTASAFICIKSAFDSLFLKCFRGTVYVTAYVYN